MPAMCAGGAIDCHLKLLVTPSEPCKTLMHGFNNIFLSFPFLHLFKPLGSIYDSHYFFIMGTFIKGVHFAKCFSVCYQLGQYVILNNKS